MNLSALLDFTQKSMAHNFYLFFMQPSNLHFLVPVSCHPSLFFDTAVVDAFDRRNNNSNPLPCCLQRIRFCVHVCPSFFAIVHKGIIENTIFRLFIMYFVCFVNRFLNVKRFFYVTYVRFEFVKKAHTNNDARHYFQCRPTFKLHLEQLFPFIPRALTVINSQIRNDFLSLSNFCKESLFDWINVILSLPFVRNQCFECISLILCGRAIFIEVCILCCAFSSDNCGPIVT